MKKFIQICFVCVFIVCTLVSFININDVYAENITIESDKQYTIDLGDAIYDDATKSSFSFPNATFTSKDNAPSPTIFSVTVSDGTVELSSEDSTTLGNATIIKDKGNSKKSVTLMWNSNSGSKDVIKNIIHTLKFTFVEDMKITITVNGGTTNISSLVTPSDQNYTTDKSGVTLTQWSENGHYYLYVPYYVKGSKYMTWREAYNNALDFYLGGMQGYLVTLTIPGEQEYLNNLADANVWTGATVLGTEEVLYTGGSDNPLVEKLNGEKIETGAYLYYVGTPMANDDPNYNNMGFVKAAQTYKNIVKNNNNIDSPLIGYYYWAAGPEAGESVRLKDNSGNTIITLYNNPSTSRELNGGSTGPGAMWKYNDMDGYHQWQHESCTAAYVGEVAGFTGFNDIIEGNFKNFDNAAAKGYVVEFGGWSGHDKTDEDGVKNEETVNFTFGENEKQVEPKSTKVTISEVKTETDESGKLKITISNVRDDEYYAVIDLNDNNATKTNNVYDSEEASNTLSPTNDGWFSKSDNSTTLIWKDLDPTHQYKVVKIKKPTDDSSNVTSPGSVTDSGIIAKTIKATYFTDTSYSWYIDEECSTSTSFNTRNTSDVDDTGIRTVYLKIKDGYKYTSTNALSINNASYEKVNDNLYKVTYTIPSDNDITISPNTPSKEVTGDIDLSDKQYDGTNLDITSQTITINTSDSNTGTLSSSDYTYTWYSVDELGNETKMTDTPKDVGVYHLVVEFNKDTYYGSISKSITISKKSLSFEISADNKKYDGSTEASFEDVTGTNDDGTYKQTYDTNCNNEKFVISMIAGNYNDENVGSNKPIEVSYIILNDYNDSGFKESNYNITFTYKGTITKASANVSANDTSYTYDGLGHNIELNDVPSGSDIKYYSDETHTTSINPLEYCKNVPSDNDHKYTIYYTISNPNYEDVTGGSATVQINPKEVSISGLIVNDKQYDGTTNATVSSASNLVIEGLIPGDDVSVTTGTVAFPDKELGTYDITVSGYSLSGTYANNYTLTNQPSAKASIKNPMINIEDKVYDGSALSISSVSSYNSESNSSETIEASKYQDSIKWYKQNGDSWEELDSAPSDAGTYKVTLTVTDLDNGNLEQIVTIEAKPINVKIEGLSKTYDGYTSVNATESTTTTITDKDGNNVSDVTISNLSDLNFLDRYAGENKPVSVGSYSLSSDNYVVSSFSASGTINKKNLTVTGLTAKDKQYDDTKTATVTSTTYGLDGVIEIIDEETWEIILSDEVYVKANDSLSAEFSNTDVGTWDVTANTAGFTIYGSDAGNYTVNDVQKTEASIKAKDASDDIEVTLSSDGKEYDGAPITISSVTLKQDNTTTTVTNTSKNDNGDPWYEYKWLSYAKLPNGHYAQAPLEDGKFPTSSGQYVLELTVHSDNLQGTVSKSVVITRRPVTVSGIKFNDKEYDGNTSLTYDLSNVLISNVVSGEELKLADTYVDSDTIQFIDPNVGDNKETTLINNFNLADGTNGLAENYVLVGDQEASASIYKKEIEVKVPNTSKIYDGTNDVTFTDITVEGVNNETITIKGLKGTMSSINAGINSITGVDDTGATITNGDNYKLVYVYDDTSVTVSPKQVDITADDIYVKKDSGTISDFTYTINTAGVTKEQLNLLLSINGDTSTVGDYDIGVQMGNSNYSVNVLGGKVYVYDKSTEGNLVVIKDGTSTSNSFTNPTLNNSESNIADDSNIITDNEKNQTDNKTHIAKVWIEVSDTSDSTISSISKEDSKTIDKLIKSYVGEDADKAYFDADLYKKYDNENKKAIKTTDEEISVTIKLPDLLINSDSSMVRTYKIIRYHISSDNKTSIEAIDTTYNEADKTITFKSDKFSTFIIAYSDKQRVSISENTNNDDSSNNSEGHVITCEEYNHSKDWTWSKKEGKCVYKASKTSTD